jgi:hypothetical protein
VTGRADGTDGVGRNTGWASMSWEDWRDHDAVRHRLDQGADPESWSGGRPLHRAAWSGSPEVVAELARRVTDVDAVEHGTTALWQAVVSHRPDTARALAAAGADPWRSQIAGWSPGRLSLAGPTPDLFTRPHDEPGLTEPQRAAAAEAARLIAALGRFHYEGTGLACVSGIDAEEAIRRLEATPAEGEDTEDMLRNPYDYDVDETLHLIGVTTVPGGCVITQPWGYAPSMPGVVTRLSTDTVCYGLYANPKSGNQGSITRNGAIEGWDLHPGGGPDVNDSPEEVLTSYLYAHNAVAYCCAYAGLRLTDARAVVGPPDSWVELPERDYWAH